MTEHQIVFGDSRSLDRITDRSVQLIVTSPPYWQLKDYGAQGQIGFHDSYESYINNLNLVWQECHRVLADGCRLCINIGDQFARSVYYGRYKVIPIRTEIIRFCEFLGMDYMGAVIWQKATTMHTSGGGAVMGSFPYPRNGILKIDYEFILIFKKPGTAPKPTEEQKRASALTKEEWNQFFASHWHFAGAKQSGHIAMFPEELPRRLIRMFSFVGETVLDPFLGSGTTSLAAKNLGRNSVGYEINREFAPIVEEKLRGCQTSLEEDAHITFCEDTGSPSFSFDRLPYIFRDPHKMDKKGDVKKYTFGSKIDGKEKSPEKLYRVKTVLSPEKLRLDSGAVVQLIGIQTRQERTQEATAYLEKLLRGRRVFLRQDGIWPKTDEAAPCYLYLDNKTFVNRHLLRTGFVDMDEAYCGKYREKFAEDVTYGKRMGVEQRDEPVSAEF